MRQKYYECMALAQHLESNPSLFITMTLDPNCEEIKEFTKDGINYLDRPDICSRIFEMKFQFLLKLITKEHIFGKIFVIAYFYDSPFYRF